MKITSTRFDRAITRPDDEPAAPGPQIVFLGRSNVGKSSLINRLLGTKGLARTSSEPGRTREIHFYRVNEACWFVDLPGYGYARVPESVRRAWKPLVEGFLRLRSSRIALALLVLDARRERTELDATMQEWLETQGIPYVAVATKSDKLSTSELLRATRELERFFDRPFVVSAKTGVGVPRLWRELDQALSPPAGDASGKQGRSRGGEAWTEQGL